MAVLVALALRKALSGIIGDSLVYITFFPAIMLAAMLGGSSPGLLATALSAIAAALWVIPDRGPISLNTTDAVGIAAFACLGALMSMLGGFARHRAAAYKSKLAVRQSEHQFFENSVVGMVKLDLSARFLEANDRFCRLTGYTRQDLSGITAIQLFCQPEVETNRGSGEPDTDGAAPGSDGARPDSGGPDTNGGAPSPDGARPGDALLKFLEGRSAACDIEICFARRDGGKVWLHLAAGLIRDVDGQPVHIAAIVEDVSSAHRARAEREMTIEFLRIVNQADGTGDLIRAASVFLQQCSGCEAFGIRLKDGEDFPYIETRGFSDEFVELDNFLCARQADGKACLDSSGKPVLECLCGRVIRGQANPEKPFFTPGGSFWSNDTTEWGRTATPEDEGINQRNRCNAEGYESVALVPLEVGSERLGLVQMNDSRKGMFTADTIALWERLAGYLAVAVAKSRAEKALRDSEERYRTLVENSPDAIFVHRDGLFLYANPAAARLYGASDGAELVGTRLMDRLHPDDRARIQAGAALVLQGGQSPLVESRAVRLDGRDVCIEATASHIHFGGDSAIQVIAHDISERKLAETMSSAVNAVHQVIHSTRDLSEMMQRAVSEAARATGSDSAAISLRKGDHWVLSYVHGLPADLVGTVMNDDDEPHAVVAIRTKQPVAIDDALNDDRVNREHMRKWGVRSVLTVPLVTRDAAVGVLFLNHHRTTFAYSEVHLDFAVKLGSAISLAIENARLVDNLRGELDDRTAREHRISVVARLYAVLSRVNEAIVRIHDEHLLYEEICRIVAAEGAFPLVWVGLVRDREIVPVAWAGAGEYLREVRIEIDGDLGGGPTGTCVREDRSVVNDDFDRNPSMALWRKAALSRGFRASAAFPLHRNAKPIGAITLYAPNPSAFDSEHVNLLEALAADVSYALAAMDQERLRAEAEQALRESERELREVDRHKNEFMAALSHELRNPLAPIKNSLYILQHVNPDSDQARRSQAVIDRQVGQLAHLVDDLLDVTRIQRNKVQLESRRLELNELVRRTTDDHLSLFEQTGVRLEMHGSPQPLFVNADANRLAQVVGNLLQNAGKFTPRGGRVSVSVQADANRAVVRVADTGIGMTPETIGRLFQPFMQADSGLDRSKGGLGLGLALVKGIVELHGGEVRAESPGLGRGTEFIVSLPMHHGAGVKSEPAGASAGCRRRVLIIEDNVDAADSLCEALEVVGHVVEVAYNGADGLARAREFRSEVVLCDIGLPGMNGYEVARALRADRALDGVFLVALSGYAQPEDIQRASEAGFHRHLAKPPSLEKLEQLLAEAGSD